MSKPYEFDSPIVTENSLKHVADIIDTNYMRKSAGSVGEISDEDVAQITENKNSIDQLKEQLNNIDEMINIRFGETQPESPKENMIWFDTANKIIKLYVGSEFVPFGAVYQ